jgi:3-dehydroquinate synthetase
MRADKKSRAGRLRFVLPTRIGHAETVEGVPEKLVRRILEFAPRRSVASARAAASLRTAR